MICLRAPQRPLGRIRNTLSEVPRDLKHNVEEATTIADGAMDIDLMMLVGDLQRMVDLHETITLMDLVMVELTEVDQ